jgi:hypothetical protein
MRSPSTQPSTAAVGPLFMGVACGLQNRNARFDSWVPRSGKRPGNGAFPLSRADCGVMWPHAEAICSNADLGG